MPDHECSTLTEAEDKLAAGMHVLIREGSAARNFEVLHPLISRYPDRVMLCSDDKHPDDLSFMALLVIPELKLSDKGLFDGRTFQFTDLRI